MTVEDLKLIVISRRDALNNDLAQIKNGLNEIRIIIGNREKAVKGLPQEFLELQDKLAETNQRMTLTNSISDRLRFRRRIARLTANLRKLRQELNDQRVALQREIKIRKKIKHEIFDITCKNFYYTCLVSSLDEVSGEEFIEAIIKVLDRCGGIPKLREISQGVVDLATFGITEYVKAQVRELERSPPEDLAVLDNMIERNREYQRNPNITKDFSRILLRCLDGITMLRHPGVASGIEIIENYKQHNPLWWFDNYLIVLDMWQHLRLKFEPISQELDDIVLVFNSMVEELQKWEQDNKSRWILIRCGELESLIIEKSRIYPELNVFFNPVRFHRQANGE
ncbi:hypothetical protein LCGC14_1500060 [marine sediment metagenome]|uniref:Uncharacterized protein n=1 Tax=marine sediment metagenome TaxID=412755 RepID=A0A0F9J4A7_9ZZZZ